MERKLMAYAQPGGVRTLWKWRLAFKCTYVPGYTSFNYRGLPGPLSATLTNLIGLTAPWF